MRCGAGVFAATRLLWRLNTRSPLKSRLRRFWRQNSGTNRGRAAGQLLPPALVAKGFSGGFLAQGVRTGDVDVSAGVIRKLPALPDQRARRDFVLAPACAPCLGLRRQILTAGLGLHLRTALRTHPITKLSGPPGRPREASAALTLVGRAFTQGHRRLLPNTKGSRPLSNSESACLLRS